MGGNKKPAMSTTQSLIDQLERALAAGTNAQRITMLSRVTDLFIEGAGRYSPGQINLFDEVIVKLVTAIEAKARAKLSSRLAPVHNAPSGVVRMLAFDDNIEVARPVLTNSERLDDADLVANASNKSQQHLAAIAERRSLSEAVTEVLVARGDRQVVNSVARNAGARFSDAGFRMLVKRASGDDTLAMHVGARRDVPRQHFLRLLQEASAAVRERLAAEHPDADGAVETVLGEVVGGIRNETRKVSPEHVAARSRVEQLHQARRLGETEIYGFARERKFEETAIALSLSCGVELDVVERALLDLEPRHGPHLRQARGLLLDHRQGHPAAQDGRSRHVGARPRPGADELRAAADRDRAPRARLLSHAPEPPGQPRRQRLVSRFRRSYHFAASTFTNVGTKGHLQLYDSSVALDLTFLQ